MRENGLDAKELKFGADDIVERGGRGGRGGGEYTKGVSSGRENGGMRRGAVTCG